MSTGARSGLQVDYRLVVLIILLVGAALRLYGLNNLSPPGLAHDEVAHWLINQDILEGNHAVYFLEAFGHEAGFHYYQTLFMVLLGDNALALRLPSAFAGLLLVAVNFAFARRLFGLKSALLSAGLLAVLLWPVFYSRLALRAISLPLLSGLSAYFWWSGWQGRPSTKLMKESNSAMTILSENYRFRVAFILSAICAGLSLYTYMAGRAVPIFYLLFTLYLFLFHRKTLKSLRTEVALFFLIFIAISLPLVIFLLTNPGAEFRISEVNGPLLSLRAGELGPTLNNSLKFLGMFGLKGDPLWRNNLAFLPVFEPIIAVFFFIGLLISLPKWQSARHFFLVLWLFTSAIPSIVTIDAPSSIRIVNALVVLTIFPVIGLQVIHYFVGLSTVFPRLSPNTWRNLMLVALIGLFVLYIGRTARSLFKIWPNNEEVKFVWQQSLTSAAGYLDTNSASGPVAIGGWTPETMDSPTMMLSLRRDDLDLRYFDPTQSLIIPAITADQRSRIIRPTILPFDPYLETQVNMWGFDGQDMTGFTKYEINSAPNVRPEIAKDVTFENQLTFLGFDSFHLGDKTEANSEINLTTYWRVDEPPTDPRKLFLHLVAEDGDIVDQSDGLGAPAAYWQKGDLIMQRHELVIPSTNSSYTLRLGVYNPETGRRLLTRAGADFVHLTSE
jgi:4-amino-4-deoxy-L-arabinose transferase-like glycosyltransferase